jgi:predicted transcriptional regulator
MEDAMMDQVIGFTVQMQVRGWLYLAFLVGIAVGYGIRCIVDFLNECHKTEVEAHQNLKDAENILADSNKDN